MTARADVVVIGAGLGGLACAADLASRGAGVVVLERHSLVGGYASSFTRGPFTFDVSQHLVGGLGDGGSFWQYLDRLGVSNDIEVVRPRLVATILDSRGTFEIPNDPEACREALTAIEPGDGQALRSFLDSCQSVHRDTMAGALDGDMRRLLRGLRATGKRSFMEALDASSIGSSRIRALLSVPWVLLGLPPSRASHSWFAKVITTNYSEGTGHIVGGGQALSNALAARAVHHGAEIRTGLSATRIMTRSGHVSAVQTQEGVIETGCVVASLDPWSLGTLLDESDEPGGEPSLSMVAVYMGLRVTPDSLGIPEGTTFLLNEEDSETSYRASLKGDLPRTDIVLSSPSSLDGGYAPEGKGMIHAVALVNGRPWFDLDARAYARNKAEATRAILSRLEERWPGLTAAIEVQETATPRTMNGYTRNHLGAVYGLAQTPSQSGAHRPGASTDVPGLFRTGAWVLPGGGYSAATLSGLMTSREVSGHLASAAPAAGKTAEDRFNLRIFYEDTDVNEVTYHVSYLRFFDRARTEMFMRIARERNVVLPRALVTHVDVNYHRPSGLGDSIEIVTRGRFESDYRVVFEQLALLESDGTKLAEARTELAFIDESGNPAPCPVRRELEGP